MSGGLLTKAASLFSGGNSTPNTPMPLPTAPSDSVAQAAAQRARSAGAKKKGRASTILAGNDDTGYSPSVKKLLGE